MSRELRIEYPGAMYHLRSRGDQREDIFRNDEDHQKFVSALGEACGKTEFIIDRRVGEIGVKLFSTGGLAEVRVVQAWDMAPSNPY